MMSKLEMLLVPSLHVVTVVKYGVIWLYAPPKYWTGDTIDVTVPVVF